MIWVVQVIGKKTVWLAPPDLVEEMYPYDSTTECSKPESPKPEPSKPESPARQSPVLKNDGLNPRFWTPADDIPSCYSSRACSVFSEPPPSSPQPMPSTAAGTPTSMLSNTSRVPIFD